MEMNGQLINDLTFHPRKKGKVANIVGQLSGWKVGRAFTLYDRTQPRTAGWESCVNNTESPKSGSEKKLADVPG